MLHPTSGDSAVYCAAKRHHLAATRFLLDAGATAEWTAADVAAGRAQHTDSLILVAAGQATDEGACALMDVVFDHAAATGTVLIGDVEDHPVGMWLPDAPTPFALAATQGNCKAVLRLAAAGMADATVVTPHLGGGADFTLLSHSAREPGMAEVLLGLGADGNRGPDGSGACILRASGLPGYLLAFCVADGTIPYVPVPVLVRGGVDLTVTYPADALRESTRDALREPGVDEGMTPAMVAAAVGTVKFLMDACQLPAGTVDLACANTTAGGNGYTALAYAVREANLPCVLALVDAAAAGVDVGLNARIGDVHYRRAGRGNTTDRCTVLHLAVRLGVQGRRRGTIRALLRAGRRLDLHAVDSAGQTALAIANLLHGGSECAEEIEGAEEIAALEAVRFGCVGVVWRLWVVGLWLWAAG